MTINEVCDAEAATSMTCRKPCARPAPHATSPAATARAEAGMIIAGGSVNRGLPVYEIVSRSIWQPYSSIINLRQQKKLHVGTAAVAIVKINKRAARSAARERVRLHRPY